MTASRNRAAALLAVAAALACAAPAAAAPDPLVAGGSFARTVPFIDGTVHAFECHAAAPGATSTTVSSCVLTDGLHSIAAPASSSSGPVAATDEAVATSPLSEWRVCWTASAAYGDGTSQSTSGCTIASSVAGV
jgi:hypothetical protein